MSININKELIEGNIKEVKELMSRGLTWDGSKHKIDRDNFTFPKNPEDFSFMLMLFFELGFLDRNGEEGGIPFMWFFAPKSNFTSSASSVIKECNTLYKEAKFKTERFKTDGEPQIKVWKHENDFILCLEVYEDDQATDLLNKIISREEVLEFFSQMVNESFYTY